MYFKKSQLTIRILSLLVILNINFSYGQSDPRPQLLKLTAASDSFYSKQSFEKLYLQCDKSSYVVDDTLWFKAYLVNSAYLTPSKNSGVMYLDIANDSNKVVKQYRLPVFSGISWGNIHLNEKEFKPGAYTLRAYTNWMRNLGIDAYFFKRLYISGTDENSWLINEASFLQASNLNIKAKLTDFNQVPYALKSLQLYINSPSKHLFKAKLETNLDGLINIDFKVPDKTYNLTLTVEGDGKKAAIPILLKEAGDIDLQFLSEGGNLIGGVPAHIGFKAIDKNGKGVDVSGLIIDHDHHQVASFSSLHNGMGSFDLQVVPGEFYTARLMLPGGVLKSYPLPAVENTGTVLLVNNPFECDSLEVTLAAGAETARQGKNYYLSGVARGIVCYAASVNFNLAGVIKRKIAKELFPSGITRFTLSATDGQPLNERITFIDHGDNLKINVSANKAFYKTRDSVSLNIRVTNNKDLPVSGNLSLAVTDDGQVKSNQYDENILSRFLLTSDLKGYVEEPGYYYPAKSKLIWQALDNLLLTQGWIKYNLHQNSNPTYREEQDVIVSGHVNNMFNRPVRKTKVILFSKSPQIVKDTVTDNDGKFVFNRFPKVDTPIFFIQAVNRNNRSFNVGVSVDEFKPPVFEGPRYPGSLPWNVNIDTTMVNHVKTSAKAKQLELIPQNGHLLKEVKIKARKVISGSQNLNGAGNADLVIDQKELEAAGKKTFLDLLIEKVPGFKEGFFLLAGPTPKAERDRIVAGFIVDNSIATDINQNWYFVKDKPIKFIIDGIPLYKVLTMSLPALTNINDYLTSHSAEDIKGIEVNTSSKYSMNYIPMEWGQLISPADIAFVEITTRGGSGPVIRNTPGTYLYKPLALSFPKQFYKPKYPVADSNRQFPDLRSTIDWEPNIKTNENGEAIISFYSADSPGTYSVKIEGSDMNGNFGVFLDKLIIK